ncbi:uncharacterized protein LOC126993836 isoform X7 [Eriocheir sinensis]|uniref:uncharacterized protein LOC126993836 isoform X7 n=1 Tax=Eriocheir sinensis TaxID=95602 RepID=UPI0021C6D2FA|nr:uncharacterized protein LOC126993836 isoform X7 [Eriocheir sinensis]
MLWEGWCSSAGRCHNTGHSSPQQQSLHRQVILHQQAFQQLGEIDTTKRRRGGGGGRRRRGTQEEPIECAVSRRQTEMSVQFCRRKEVVLVNSDDLYFSLQGTVL